MGNLLQAKLLPFIIATTAVLLVGLTLYTAFFGVFPDGIQRSAHLLLVLILVFAMALKSSFDAEVPAQSGLMVIVRRVWVILALTAGAIATAHQLINFDAINDRYGAITSIEIVFGALLVVALFDACRRTIGWPIVILAGLFIAYGLLGAYLPDPIAHRGYSLKRVASQIYLGGGGIFGTPLGVSATFVTGVVVLGTLLEKTGAGQVMMDFATALTGRMRGGPAKAAVVGSSLMGMISGTAVANVLTTGPISIPLMRKSGYRKEAAGAIEAVASTGGQLMPPVMGAAAFIMAEFTETSYLTIAKAAFLPAVIFYAVLLAMVHFEAAKRRIPILRDADSVTDWGSILRNSYLLIPLPVFISMLLNGYSIMLSSFWAIVASTLVSYLNRNTALTPRRIVETCVAAAQAVIPVALACAAAGVIIGIITLTGIGLKFSTLVVLLSNGSLPLALVLTMLTCLVLGMGLPTAAAYILVATLVAPALVKPGTEWLLENVVEENISETKLSIASNAPYDIMRYYYRDHIDMINFPYTRYYDRGAKDWDYAIYYCNYINPYQLRKNIWPPKNTIHEIKVDDVTVCAIVKRENKDDYYGITKMNSGISGNRVGEIMEGLSLLENAVEYDPYNEIAYLYLARGYITIKQYDKGRTALNKLLQIYPDYDKALNLMGFSFISEAQVTNNIQLVDKAIGLLNKVITINYKFSDGYYNLGLAFYLKRNEQAAMTYLNKAVETNPRHKRAYLLISEILQKNGNEQKAMEIRRYVNSL